MTNAIPAGWYPDPQDPTQVRWWDGAAWTANTQPKPAASPAPSTPAASPQPVTQAPTEQAFQPVQATQPTQPVQPTQPAQPTQPTQPTQPAQPTRAAEPVRPAGTQGASPVGFSPVSGAGTHSPAAQTPAAQTPLTNVAPSVVAAPVNAGPAMPGTTLPPVGNAPAGIGSPVEVDDADVKPTKERKISKGLMITLIAVLVLAGLAAAYQFLGLGKGLIPFLDDAEPAVTEGLPTPSPSETMEPVVIPEGYTALTSSQGLVTFPVNDQWTVFKDLTLTASADDEKILDPVATWVVVYPIEDDPETEVDESGGGELTADSGDLISVIANKYLNGTVGLEDTATTWYAQTVVQYSDVVQTQSSEFTTGQGYSAWRIDFTGMANGNEVTSTLITIADGNTSVFLSLSSNGNWDKGIVELQMIADCLVINDVS